jgi:hypothetical protein
LLNQNDIIYQGESLEVSLIVSRAINDLDLCQRFSEGHRKLLENHNVDLGPVDTSWYTDRNVYILVVKDELSDEILGGSKLVISDGKGNLPMEKLLSEDYPELSGLLSNLSKRGIVEISSLWNSRSIAGWGLGSEQLIKASIVVSSFLDVDRVVTFCSPFVTRFAESYGFNPLEDFGENGAIPFPDNRWMSTINVLYDIDEMRLADISCKTEIFELKQNPIQTITYEKRGRNLKVNFYLIVQ